MVVKNCHFCRKVIHIYACKLNLYKRYYCSKLCADKDKKGKPFTGIPFYKLGIKRIITEETREKMRQAKFKNPVRYWACKKRPEIKNEWRKGKKFTPEQVEKRRELAIKKGYGKWMKGKKQSLSAKQKMSLAIKGNLHWNWKGGITPLNLRIRNSIEYKTWRRNVFERDNFTCQFCKVRKKNGKYLQIHADHIRPFSLFPNLRFDINNGRTLCISCHRETESYSFGRRKSLQLDLL